MSADKKGRCKKKKKKRKMHVVGSPSNEESTG